MTQKKSKLQKFFYLTIEDDQGKMIHSSMHPELTSAVNYYLNNFSTEKKASHGQMKIVDMPLLTIRGEKVGKGFKRI